MKFKIGDKVRVKALEEINKINSKYNIIFPESLKFLCNKEGTITHSSYDHTSTLYIYVLTFPNFPEKSFSFYESELSLDRALKEFIDIQQWL